MVYHAIVRHRVAGVFAALDRGDAEPMLATLAESFVYRFEGDTALGGERRSLGAMRAWWKRLFRLLPGVRFDVEHVVVGGPPWQTVIAAKFHVRADGPDGPYENVVMQFSRMSWGRLTSVHTLEDTSRLADYLKRSAAAGVEEASAAPITDETAQDDALKSDA